MSFILGTIVKGVGGLYTVQTENGVHTCPARGVFRHRDVTPLVGDSVMLALQQDGTYCLDDILPRKTELLRPKVANVSLAVLVFAARKPSLHFELLDRFLALVVQAGVQPLLCINKSDLAKDGFLEELQAQYAPCGCPVLAVSAKDGCGIDTLAAHMQGHVAVFAGPSGVGKTSLLNCVVPNENRTVGGLSKKTDRGKHTTRHTELIAWAQDSFIVDSPGFTSLDLTRCDIHADNLHTFYPEFRRFDAQCFFNNCYHDTEPDCAVKLQIGIGVHEKRYERYLSLREQLK